MQARRVKDSFQSGLGVTDLGRSRKQPPGPSSAESSWRSPDQGLGEHSLRVMEAECTEV
jgi:hypothetical protein